ncbi:MAG: prepilin peptidase [bacterium]|nr:prepilin peptidase [bacterium]
MTFFEPFTTIFVLLFGLVIGSFLNVCILRLPLGQSIVHPRSRCPQCKRPIAWYQNIPVLSWVALRGKCASCSTKISVRYPAIELASGVILVVLWRWLGPNVEFPIAALFALSMLVLFFTDWDHQLLPDAITLTGVAMGLALAWFNPYLHGEGWGRVWSSLAGAILGAGLLWGFGAAYGKLRGVEAMGMGDVKMMGMVGAFAGPFGVLMTIFAASLVGAVVGVALIPLRGRTLQDTLPFGCFLAPAAMAALLTSQRVAAAYLAILLPNS